MTDYYSHNLRILLVVQVTFQGDMKLEYEKVKTWKDVKVLKMEFHQKMTEYLEEQSQSQRLWVFG